MNRLNTPFIYALSYLLAICIKFNLKLQRNLFFWHYLLQKFKTSLIMNIFENFLFRILIRTFTIWWQDNTYWRKINLLRDGFSITLKNLWIQETSDFVSSLVQGRSMNTFKNSQNLISCFLFLKLKNESSLRRRQKWLIRLLSKQRIFYLILFQKDYSKHELISKKKVLSLKIQATQLHQWSRSSKNKLWRSFNQ